MFRDPMNSFGEPALVGVFSKVGSGRAAEPATRPFPIESGPRGLALMGVSATAEKSSVLKGESDFRLDLGPERVR